MSRVASIKKSQKESLLRKEISGLLQQASLDIPAVAGLDVSRVVLSDDKSVCSVFFYTPDGIEVFERKLKDLTLLKASLRKAIAQRIASRFVPEIVFKYDTQLEKQLAIERLLDTLKEPGSQ